MQRLHSSCDLPPLHYSFHPYLKQVVIFRNKSRDLFRSTLLSSSGGKSITSLFCTEYLQTYSWNTSSKTFLIKKKQTRDYIHTFRTWKPRGCEEANSINTPRTPPSWWPCSDV